MSASSESDILELANVNKRFGTTPALVDCNLKVRSGEFITLLGPSGCGKTTTLRLIAGFLRPDSGEVRIDGAILSSAALHVPPESRNMGMVFQSFAVWPHMTVFDNVALPLRIRGLARDEIERRCGDILRLCRLEAMKSRDPHQLSGGQLQRVALARALVYRPRLLLLDEPLSNLDAALREEMRRELHTIHKAAGTTFVLVTHDQVEAMSLSDRVVVMNQGRIEQIGTPREIYRHPRTEFVAQFVGAANLLKGEILASSTEGSCHFRVGGMTLVARPARNCVAGSACTAIVHPEAIAIAPNKQLGDNSFQGMVREVFFLGRNQEIVVEVQGVRLRAMESQGQVYEPGDIVQVTIPPSRVMLV
jgi:ABC-type Fe3+/spermidine/putrescine transport system ATPase subunit